MLYECLLCENHFSLHQKSGKFIFRVFPSWPHHLTSVTASKEAECLSSRSMDRMWFFLQAIWRGVNPFWRHGEKSLQLDKACLLI